MHTRLLAAADIALLLDTIGRDKFMDLTIERMRSRFADRHDIGASIALESIPVDPYDPYARPKEPAKGGTP